MLFKMASLHLMAMLVMLIPPFAVATHNTAVPTPSKSTLSVPLKHNIGGGRNPHWEYYRTLQKYNIPVPEQVYKIAQTFKPSKVVADEASIPAEAHMGDLLWLAPVEIGTPPQTLYLDLDTGSADSWVFSTDTNVREVNGQDLYHPAKSTTSERINNCTWSIMYGDFSTSSGICYRDTFSLGDIKIEGMTIESATRASEMFTDTEQMSGLVGLAWGKLAQTTPVQPCLMDFLPDNMKEPIFTVDFIHNGTGSFNFGFIDESLHVDEIEYVNVDTTDGFWAVNYNGFRMSGEDIKYEFARPKQVIVDTGSTLLFAPQAAVDTYYASVPGAEFDYTQYAYVLPCNNTPPDYIVELSDKQGNKMETTIPGEYVPYAHIDNVTCFGGIQSLGSFSGLEGILGDVYLKSGFAVFDVGQKKFGMAPKILDVDSRS